MLGIELKLGSIEVYAVYIENKGDFCKDLSNIRKPKPSAPTDCLRFNNAGKISPPHTSSENKLIFDHGQRHFRRAPDTRQED